ncbi:Uncharacterized protein Rs2_06720 [Raphanus sativus]|nr:Uncharacterized protein Rs2_06720 [Raphanus sativus]
MLSIFNITAQRWSTTATGHQQGNNPLVPNKMYSLQPMHVMAMQEISGKVWARRRSRWNPSHIIVQTQLKEPIIECLSSLAQEPPAQPQVSSRKKEQHKRLIIIISGSVNSGRYNASCKRQEMMSPFKYGVELAETSY